MDKQARMWCVLVLGSAALGIMGITFSASVNADDDTDFTYLLTLESEDIYLSENTAIAAGQAVCADFAGGTTRDEIVVNTMGRTGLSLYEAGFLTGAAIAAYCPQFEDNIY